ncbi:methanogenesis marker 14 protein [Candidatus Thorarchaeota archaeon]|nr:MAG: methanogenesis marker 14 protein [Candidatus Thorarchaeota archaeon]
MGAYFTVASVELGNTTTKCIICSTNLKTAEIFEIAKEVRMTRTVRAPEDGEKVFGKTLTGVFLTRDSVSELIEDILLSALTKAGLDMERDLHFVVRSTGVTAGFAEPHEVDAMVRALADGCIKAGVPPNRMTAALSPENLPPGLQEFTWLKRVYFDGAVASCLPPPTTTLVANEMEGELVTAGMKGAAKSTKADFRNPVMTLDFGTTLAGRITDDEFPYCNTIGSFVGLAGAIPDAIARGSGLVDQKEGTALELPLIGSESKVSDTVIDRIHKAISVEIVKGDCDRYGTVPVNVNAAHESSVTMIGVDVGSNGSKLSLLEEIGKQITDEYGPTHLKPVLDEVQVHLVQRILTLAEKQKLLLPHTALGVTGRAITTGNKPQILSNSLRLSDGRLWTSEHILLIVDDGLALGAAVAARCMNSMGTRHNPMGGRQGDRCIMAEREKMQRNRSDT